MDLDQLRALAAKTKKPAFTGWGEVVEEIQMAPLKNAMKVAAEWEWVARVVDLATPPPNMALLGAAALPLSMVFQEDTWL